MADIKALSMSLVHKVKSFFVESYRDVISLQFWKDMLVVASGIVFYIIGFSFFIYPQRITTGGLAGLCNLITLSTGMPIDIPYRIINYSLILVAFFFLSNKFVFRTLVSIFMLVVSIEYFTRMAVPDPRIEESWRLMFLADQPVVALIIGSIFIGLGLGMVFSVSGSTGGTDIIVAIISKYKDMSFGRIFMLVDGSIVVASFFVNVFFAINPLEPTVALEKLIYSIMQVIFFSLTIDWFNRSNQQSVQILVFSRKYKELNEVITRKIGRGCTILDGHGGYSGDPVKVLVVVTRKRHSVHITRTIQEVDPDAFVTMTDVHGVYGQGFQALGKK